MIIDYVVKDEYGQITNTRDLSALVNRFASQLAVATAERDHARSVAVTLEQVIAPLRRAVLADVRDQLEQSGQLAAAVFVGRMITKEQQHG